MRLRNLNLNKKGDLMENALSTIIAVLGIALLIFAVWKLYDYMAGQDERNAKKTADFVSDKIDALGEGETTKFAIKGIEGWFLTGWGKDDANRPDKCAFSSCICFCKGELGGMKEYNIGDIPGYCQKNGFCRKIETDKIINVGQTLSYEKYESAGFGGVYNRYAGIFPVISFNASNLYEISLKKEKVNNKISLTISPAS